MKNKCLILSAAFLSAPLAYAGGEGWMQDFEAAKKMAVEEKKDLLIDFTGSDWCPPCKDLNARVLSQDSFIAEAQENYILVELDFPNDKSNVPENITAQNKKLMETYEVKGFPTILLTDAQGRPFGQSGHRPGTPEDYLAHLAELQKKKVNRDVEFAKAEKAEGVAKAKALYAGLQAVPEELWKHYSEVIEEIHTNDPEDEGGLKAKESKKAADLKAAAELQVKMRTLKGGIEAAMATGDNDAALKIVDEFVAKEGLEGVLKQQALGIKINILRGGDDIDALEKAADEIIAADPQGEYSDQVRDFKMIELKERREALEKKSSEAEAAEAVEGEE